MTAEQQIILQTLGDVWMVFTGSFLTCCLIQIYNDYKGVK